MKQREVTDSENTRWTCVHTYSMSEEKTSEQASELEKTEDGNVTVVCTPSGGSQTVRLKLPVNWEEEMDDTCLMEEIAISKK